MELHLPGSHVIEIGSSAELASALASLATIPAGGAIELKATVKHTIYAVRDDSYWVVTAKRPGWWFRQTLTTCDWIDPAARVRKPFWVSRGSLSDEKVLKVFTEFYEGKRFSQPTVGA